MLRLNVGVKALAVGVLIGVCDGGFADAQKAEVCVVLSRYGGSLELPDDGLLFRPCLYPTGGGRKFAAEDETGGRTAAAHEFRFFPSGRRRIAGSATFAATPAGGVAADWTVEPQEDGSDDRFAVQAEFPLPRYSGAEVAVGGGALRLSSDLPLWSEMKRRADSLELREAGGAVRLRLAFGTSTEVLLKKLANAVELRIYFAGRKLHVQVDSGNDAGCAFREGCPVVVAAGDDWIPFANEVDVVEGGPLDFTRFRGTDMPAGRHGRVVARDGHFEFEGLPGRPQRFYGVNLCGDACTPGSFTAKRLAAVLRKLGYNAVRLHHHERQIVKPDAMRGSVELDPVAMARFDELVAACIGNGLYLTTDLYVSRAPIAYRAIGLDREGDVPIDEFKMLVLTHEPAYSNFTAFARNFLNHVNPRTGRRYADEPAFVGLSLVNEGNIGNGNAAAAFNEKFRLLERTDRRALADCERRFVRRMRAFLREEIKTDVPLTNMNNFWDDDPPALGVVATELDYADNHFYVDHPDFMRKDWRLPSNCPNANPLVGPDAGSRRIFAMRPLGKPYAVSEYNFAWPGKYRGVAGILTGALGARQDWGMLMRFAWRHGVRGVLGADRGGYFDMAGDPLGLASERASVCLFLRRDMEVADSTAVIRLPPGELASDGAPFKPWDPFVACARAAWRARLGVIVSDVAPSGVTELSAYPGPVDAAQLRTLEKLPTGGVTIDAANGTFALDTPRTAGGFAPRGVIAAGPVRAALSGSPATVWVSSLDGEPIVASGRLLLTHLTDVLNAETSFGDLGHRVLLDNGHGPHLMHAGRADVALSVRAGNWQVRALSGAGRCRRIVPSRYRDGQLSFVSDVAADASDATWLYEIVDERK